jgi:hypothetical protein
MKVHAHHSDPIGFSQVRNDYTALPLRFDIHVPDKGHIGYDELEQKAGEDLQDLVMFYMSIYIEYLEGKYDIEKDEECQFYELKRRWAAL